MKTETKWAVIASLLVFAWLFIEKIMGWHTAEKMDTRSIVALIASFVIFIYVYYMETREKRERDLGGVMTFKQGFWSAAVMTLVFIPLSTLLIYFFLSVVSPDLPSILMDFATKGSIERDPVDYLLSGHLTSAIFGGLVFSVIFALINKKVSTA